MSSIEWTEATWNPVIGCTPVSPGCLNCYAATMARRLEGMGKPEYAPKRIAPDGTERIGHIAEALEPGTKTVRIAEVRNGRAVFTGEVRTLTDRLDVPLKRRKPTMYFVNSMSDLFHEAVPFEFVDRVFAVTALCPQHTFQVLTKRPERMAEYLTDKTTPFRVARAIDVISVDQSLATAKEEFRDVPGFPGYRVSNLGTVFGPRTALQPQVGEQGHCRVTLYKDGAAHRELVHRLVLSVFDRPPTDGEQACHKNGDPGCNAIHNLRWGTQSDNWQDRTRHGRHQSYTKLTPDEAAQIKALIQAGEPAEHVGPRFGVSATQARNIARGDQWGIKPPIQWPLPGVWLGTSVENQEQADKRIPHLLRCPAAVRFLSCEPLLGAVDLGQYLPRTCCMGERDYLDMDGEYMGSGPCDCHGQPLPGVDWVIAGGESGPGARPCDVAWIRSIVSQCRDAGVAVFVKQLGRRPVIPANEPWTCLDRKGGDPAEWPEDLRVREMPEARGV